MTHRHLVAVSAVSAAIVGSIVFLVPRALVPEKHLPAPERLSPMVKALVHRRMERHGRDMTELVWSVVLLDQDATQRTAERIAGESGFARPNSEDATELN